MPTAARYVALRGGPLDHLTFPQPLALTERPAVIVLPAPSEGACYVYGFDRIESDDPEGDAIATTAVYTYQTIRRAGTMEPNQVKTCPGVDGQTCSTLISAKRAKCSRCGKVDRMRGSDTVAHSEWGVLIRCRIPECRYLRVVLTAAERDAQAGEAFDCEKCGALNRIPTRIAKGGNGRNVKRGGHGVQESEALAS